MSVLGKSGVMARMKLCVLAVAATLVTSAAAYAGPKVCASHDVVVQRLHDAFNESVALTGKTQSNYVVQVFASKSYKTWTLTVSKAGGPTCLLASGKGENGMRQRLALL